MNVKELIENYKSYEGKWNAKIAELSRQIFLEDLKQLDEPRKVKVKQFVADWYERNENDLDYNIWDYIYNWEDQEESEFKNWFNCSKKAFQTLVNMHQFGYEIEKEKQYLVKIKATKHYLVKDENGKIFFSLAFKDYFTKKELEEADFGWVFDCPGIEIEEVERCH